MPEEPQEPDFEFEYSGDLNVGSWGYQVLNEKPKKIKKNPIGFSLPSDENTSPSQIEDSNNSLSSGYKSEDQQDNPSA